MKTVYSAPNLSLVSIFQHILEGHGIGCRVKNEFLGAGMGELPPIECWPQLCVEDEDYLAATGLITEALATKESAAWQCAACGEESEGQFTECWRCGQSRS